MERIRQPAVAGLFYPDIPDTLRADIENYLADDSSDNTADPDQTRPAVRGLIAPHAGYVYSGAVAGTAYRRVCGAKYSRVLVIGPAHRYPVRGLALPECESVRTPLGTMRVDTDGVSVLKQSAGVADCAAAHALEHSLEVHFPFIQVCLGDVPIIPLLAGNCDPQTVADAINAIWNDETLLVASTDLSHFETYDDASDHDCETIESVRAGRWREIGPSDACGFVGVAAMLILARRRRYTITPIRYRNSGDAGGDARRVVGYAAFTVEA
ncbi:MAG: AmmeMemoRadiSam system protein B [Spirochaetaceae bacterium]|nr:MAG: AmmeMemoRadiSam system protein B [Spirochaetaceae bacterium]